MFVRANFVDIYSQWMRDRSMRSGTELAQEIKPTDWSMAGNLSNRSSGVQIPRDVCTRLKRYLYSAKCSWIIIHDNLVLSNGLIKWIGHRKEIRKLTFRTLAFRRSKTIFFDQFNRAGVTQLRDVFPGVSPGEWGRPRQSIHESTFRLFCSLFSM